MAVPLQMIVGGRDEVISGERSQRLYEAWGGPKQAVSIAAAGHNDIHLHPAYWEAIRGFLTARARPPAR
jgi:fermentation-respiration switch protein FrsA (DUF1100 family)